MKTPILTILIFMCLFQAGTAQQVDPGNITVARDSFGIPYIYANTDQEAAYGLAWAQAEDNFFELQEPLLASRGLLSEVIGKKGAFLDAIPFLIDAQGVVEEKYETTFSSHFKRILSGYVQGLNEYAALHPKEVLHKDLFPLNEKDIIKVYVFIKKVASFLV